MFAASEVQKIGNVKKDGYSTSKSTFLLKILLFEVGIRWNKKDAPKKRSKKKYRRGLTREIRIVSMTGR